MVESDTDRSNTPCSTFDINGIDASCGEYLSGELTAAEVAAAARGEMGVGGVGGDDREALGERHRRDTEKRLGPIAGTRPNDLASAGWGVIFASDLDPAVVEALQPLIDFRARQAGGRFQRFAGPEGYRVGDGQESVRTFLRRRKVLPSMPADPQRVPYYLMVVGSPGAVPFRFQYGLDVVYAVGRLWFENPDGTPDLDAFERYARAVVESESVPGPWRPSRRAVFVGVANRGDRATSLGLGDLVRPLGAALAATEEVRDAGWDVQTFGPELARKDDLAGLLNGPEPPALLFTASHGMAFPNGHALQYAHQGALLCQDWPGILRWRGAIPTGHYLAADDIADGARLAGMIAFHFACFGAGTPALDDFAHLNRFGSARVLASRPFVARLPQRLLRQGALAVIGHVERAWSCSFRGGGGVGRQLQAFQSVLQCLLGGHRVGWALEYFGALYAALATELTGEITLESRGQRPDDALLADLWTAHNDARGFVVLGDPAVKLLPPQP
ncbi:MAG: hypothetical protein ACLQGP_02095 [Isosphaeraceae bacterium]